MAFLVGFVSAVIFGLGLGIGGMAQPDNIKEFLDIFGSWNPNLLFVMIGGIVVHSLAYRVIMRRRQPVFAPQFHMPKKHRLDWQLLTGSAIFGIGWGISGMCPGPTIVALATGDKNIFLQFLGMVLGILVYHYSSRGFSSKGGRR